MTTIATERKLLRRALDAYEVGDVLAFIETNALSNEHTHVRDYFLNRDVLQAQDSGFWLRVAETNKAWGVVAAVVYWVAENGTVEATERLNEALSRQGKATAGLSLGRLVSEAIVVNNAAPEPVLLSMETGAKATKAMFDYADTIERNGRA